MKKLLLVVLSLAVSCAPAEAPASEARQWEERAAGITIVRDEWGIPHVYGATDADAVFGMIYAQAEDDFNRIEVNYLNAMGRLAEAEGEGELYRDLRMKLFIDPAEMRRLYEESPDWLRELMDAWADGLNWFLHTHPEVQPRVLDRFEPWMALTFTEGSIGGDIERVSLRDLEGFYQSGDPAAIPAGAGLAPAQSLDRLAAIPAAASTAASVLREPDGSNGIAIAPSNTADGHSLLLINPHTSFYFRAELHMVSDEGLNAYGAVTWGQFFVYQGFNETAGWMHTSTGADNIDEYHYDVQVREDGVYYPYADEERRMQERTITVPYAGPDGPGESTFTAYFSHHGPVVRIDEQGRWVAVKLMQEPVDALTQSYTRTRAASFDEFKETMQLHTNSSNNTVFADADGNIAYFHSNFVPVRDTSFDWSASVSGMDPATEWQGLHSVDDSPNAFNPPEGWVQNTNNWPYSASGPSSPRPEDFPPYMDTFGENARGIHAVRLLENRSDFTLEGLREAAYDSQLTGFEELLPPLLEAWDSASESDPHRAGLAEQIETLRQWDLRWGVDSVPTTLAVLWGREMQERLFRGAREAGMSVDEYTAQRVTPAQRLEALAAVSERLTGDFGDWRTPWGEVNRFQRLTGAIDQTYDDEAASIPVGFTSGRWGSLASFGVVSPADENRLYGVSGNSFVAVVEFGDRLRAVAITAGGQSGDPDSPHFDDQAERYATGDLRPVHFYREDVDAHAESTYRPGERR